MSALDLRAMHLHLGALKCLRYDAERKASTSESVRDASEIFARDGFTWRGWVW